MKIGQDDPLNNITLDISSDGFEINKYDDNHN